jgi:opacity protein-like surface antigen
MLEFISVGNIASNIGVLSRTRLASGCGKSTVLSGVALAFMVFASSAALADCTAPVTDTANGAPVGNAPQFFSYGGLVGGALSATINSVNTAFLTQSTAFVGAPPNPAPDQTGGGVWTRGVGGEVNVKSTSSGPAVITAAGAVPGSTVTAATGPVNCSSTFHQDFGGVQVGTDIARLNVSGWNLHLGATAGSLDSRGSLNGGGFNSDIKVPFIGTYAAVTNGGFFADALVRGDFYQADFDSPTNNIFHQDLNARGLAVSGSAGYRFNLPDSPWWVEPSGGLIWSRVSVDPFNTEGAPLSLGSGPIQGTLKLDDIVSTTGRLGLRVGENFVSGSVLWQPFVSASVWTDFGANSTGNYASCGSLAVFGNSCAFYTGASTGFITQNAIGSLRFTNSGIGTYGQYSLGISGQIVDTGWLGFARVDFRDGERLEGWDATGGVRYQFAPDRPLAVKMPIYKASPGAVPYDWTGVYVGGVVGADTGWSRENFDGVYNPSSFFPGGGVGDAGPRVGGLLGGVELGYNYQVGKWVFGIEADATDSNTKGSTACTDLSTPGNEVLALPGHPLWNTTCGAQASWIGTVTGRLGVEWWDRTLLYLKGGAAFTHETFSADCNLGPLNGTDPARDCFNPAGALLNNLSVPVNAVGGTVGLGTEFALTRNWSAKAEWDYINFGSRSVIAADGTQISTGMTLNEVKIGANYHFTP